MTTKTQPAPVPTDPEVAPGATSVIPNTDLSIVQHPIATLPTCPAEDQHPAHPPSGPAELVVADSVARASHCRIRNGKIAHLPKLERDMVNRMLHNHVAYSKIVGALDELQINVTERNVSNWKTRGGYKEWCVEQERQINLSRLQDNLTDYLRKNDAGQLPEVGLQIAATQLSQMLLRPDAVQKLTAEPERYSKVVEMLCRLATHIQSLQKDRDEAVKRASHRHTLEFIKREDAEFMDQLRQTYTGKIGNSAREPDIPHRNELPRRDELPFREPDPKRPTFLEQMEYARKTERTIFGSPLKPNPAENATPEKSASV